MNIAAIGNTIYHAIKDDSDSQAKIRAEFKTLAMTLATNPAAALTITSATINGQSFSASSGGAGESISNKQRLSLLRWVVACLDRQGPISAAQISSF